MKITYDPKADALYVALWDAHPRLLTKDVGEGIGLDFTEDGKLVGVEVLDASAHIPAADLAVLARPSTPMTCDDLAVATGLSSETWRKLFQRGRVAARKAGRDWVAEYADALNYLESRAPSGRPSAKRKARRARAKA